MLSSCKKYLDAKSDKHYAVPSTIADFQAILDYSPKLNYRGVPAPITSGDDGYLTKVQWDKVSATSQKIYLWQRDQVFAPRYNSWNDIYVAIYYANTAVEHVSEISRNASNAAAWDNAVGEGLFFRANAFLQVAATWCQAYDAKTSKTDLGIPLRLSTDFNEPSKRSSLQQTYDQIIKDLKRAVQLLPTTQVHPYRPNKAAAYGLLARVYLYMRDYQNAFLYADSSLKVHNDLMDYNDLDSSITYPIPQFNEEIQFAAVASEPTIYYGNVDSTLYRDYADNDLRKSLYFTPRDAFSHAFRGSYTQSTVAFIGVATDEVYLMRAECEARLGKVNLALDDLNTLLTKRWKKGTFIDVTATGPKDALNKILIERRKELLFRGFRWMDIKRLNKEGSSITLKRILDNTTYTLPPNDARDALPIPDDLTELTGMKQNPD